LRGALLLRAWELDAAVRALAARAAPGWLAWVLTATGLAYAFMGAHHAVLRWTVAALGGLVGFYAVDAVLNPAALGVSATVLSWGAACALGVLGGVWPIAAGFVVWGIAGALFFARWVPFDDAFLRLVPGAVICGALGGLFVRIVASLASSVVGAATAAVGIAGILLQSGQADWLDPHPVVTLLPFSLLFVSSAAFQLTRRPPPPREERERMPDVSALSSGGAA
jgi:hypothetical protein